jgi:hypothetical protein
MLLCRCAQILRCFTNENPSFFALAAWILGYAVARASVAWVPA